MLRRIVYSMLLVILVLSCINSSVKSQIERSDLVDRVISMFNREKGNFGYNQFSLEVQAENHAWVKGLLLANKHGMPKELSDPYLFLAHNNANGLQIAFAYTEEFNRLLRLAPEEIISNESKAFYFLSTSKSLTASNWPRSAFPWSINIGGYVAKWRFNSGPHSYGGTLFPNLTWSGIDFGVPLNSTDRIVRAVEAGNVLQLVDNCLVVISHFDNWETRLLHIDGIKVKVGDIVFRGTEIGSIDETPCADADGPHLHLDIRRFADYISADGLPIGGGTVHSSGVHYNGYLERDGFLIPADVENKELAQIVNFGLVGLADESAPQKKFNDSVVICSEGICQIVPENTVIEPTKISKLQKFLNWLGYSLQFWKKSPSSIQGVATNENFACVDFDTNSLQEYYFPGTTLNLLQNATEARIVAGGWDPADRPTKASGGSNGLSNAKPLTSWTCEEGDLNPGTLFAILDDKGNCYSATSELPSMPFTLPFNPTKVWLPNSFGNLVLVDKNGQCVVAQGSGSSEEVIIPVNGDFVRAWPWGASGCTNNMSAMNDKPAAIAIAEDTKNLTPPLIVWNMTDPDPSAQLWAKVKLFRGSLSNRVLIKTIDLPVGVSQWLPDVYEPNGYSLDIIVKGGSFDNGQEQTDLVAYSIVNGPDWYPGWDEKNAEYSGDNPRTMHFSVPTGSVLDLWGSTIKVNGSALNSGERTRSVAATNTVYRLGAGEFDVEWSNG